MPHWHFICLAPPAPFEGGAQILLVGPVHFPLKNGGAYQQKQQQKTPFISNAMAAPLPSKENDFPFDIFRAEPKDAPELVSFLSEAAKETEFTSMHPGD